MRFLLIAVSLQTAAAEVSLKVQERMSYWKDFDVAQPEVKKPVSDRYLAFDYDHGGLNNIRIGWEMAAIAALESNRTLVYPPSLPLYLLSAEPSGFEYFLNMDRVQSGLSVMSIKQFIQTEKDNYAMSEALLQFASGSDEDDEVPMSEWLTFRSGQMQSAGSDEDTVCDISTYMADTKMIYQDPSSGWRIFNCGNWPNVGEPRFHKGQEGKWDVPDRDFALMRNHFIWHPDAYEIAGHVVESLGLFDYVSMHARYGDFQFQNHNNPKDTMLSPSGWLGSQADAVETFSTFQADSQTVAETKSFLGQKRSKLGLARGMKALGVIRTWLDGDSKRAIYIATDDTSADYLLPFQGEGLTVVRWQELMAQAEQGEGALAPMVKKFSKARIENLAGPIEQLICTFGKVFIGSEKSTFTGYIEKMRLYAQAPTVATYIQYAGVDASDKGLRLFHDDQVDSTVEATIQQEIADWDKRNALVVVDRDDVGALPKNT